MVDRRADNLKSQEATQSAFNALFSRHLQLVSARPQRRQFRDQIVLEEEFQELYPGVVYRERVRPDGLY